MLSKTFKQKEEKTSESKEFEKSPVKLNKIGSNLSKAVLGSNLSKAALKSMVGGKHRESSSRYELYAEEHEDQLASKEMG
jgi:hypothetical protein